MERSRRHGVSPLFTLVVGLGLGWGLTAARPNVLRATGGDRSDESILAAGPSVITYNEGAKVQVAQDALYYLDYPAAKLIATIPVYRNTSNSSTVLNTFVERDLVADFKLDLDTGPRPRFLMTTSSMASGSTQAYGEGLALLFVYETTTRQVAAYKMSQLRVGNQPKNQLELLEVKAFGKPAQPR